VRPHLPCPPPHLHDPTCKSLATSSSLPFSAIESGVQNEAAPRLHTLAASTHKPRDGLCVCGLVAVADASTGAPANSFSSLSRCGAGATEDARWQALAGLDASRKQGACAAAMAAWCRTVEKPEMPLGSSSLVL